MSNEKITEAFDKKSEVSHEMRTTSEREYIYLANENKELKEINLKLNEKKDEMERKLKSSKIDDDGIFSIKENILDKEMKMKELRERVSFLEKELAMSNGKIGILEKVLKRELKIEDVFKAMPEKDILKYFNDMVIKNIDKKDEIKKQNKKLLENLIFLAKEYKNMKNNNE